MMQPATDPFEPADEDEGELVAVYRAFLHNFHGTKFGGLSVTFTVPEQYKYNAMPITDFRGHMFEFRVYKPPRRKRAEEEEDDDD